jgi:5'-nucleotidase
MAKTILTNDDGIDAPGLAALYLASESLGPRIVVAPHTVRSGSGHAVTTRDPLIVTKTREGWFSTTGMPADCARVALTRLAPDAEWVLSGINRGGNLGADTYISGTVAAAREAALLGKQAIAFSQYVRSDLEIDWSWTQRQTTRTLEQLLALPPDPTAFWNVNFPHVPLPAPDPEIVFCGLDLNPLDVGFEDGETIGEDSRLMHYTGTYHGRPRARGRDVAVCFEGAIAVTRIPLDITGQSASCR